MVGSSRTIASALALVAAKAGSSTETGKPTRVDSSSACAPTKSRVRGEVGLDGRHDLGGDGGSVGERAGGRWFPGDDLGDVVRVAGGEVEGDDGAGADARRLAGARPSSSIRAAASAACCRRRRPASRRGPTDRSRAGRR